MYNCRYLPIGVSVYTYTVSCLDSPVGAIHDERAPTVPLDTCIDFFIGFLLKLILCC